MYRVSLAGLIGLMVTSAAVAEPYRLTPQDEASASSLANEIIVTGQRLPAGSPEALYEAQFASLLANGHYSCDVVRRATTMAWGVPGKASAALHNLGGTYTDCGVGTASISSGRLSIAGSPGFSVGGSDYVR